MRLLALCTQSEPSFCEKILETDFGKINLAYFLKRRFELKILNFLIIFLALNFLYMLFKDVSQSSSETANEKENGSKVNMKKLNETIINNAVLCMSNCVENASDVKLAAKLTSTNIIMDLLYLTRDGYNPAMQKNCGILISKLVKKDEKHLERLRELHGVEILYAALKNKI